MKNYLKKYSEPFLHIFIWGIFIYLVFTQIRTLGPFRKVDGSIYPPLVWSTLFNVALFYIHALVLVPRYVARQRYPLYFAGTVFLFAGIVLLNTFFDHNYSISLFSTEHEPFFAEITLNIGNKLVILSLSVGYGFTKNWIYNEKLRQQLISEKLSAELNYLKAQVNPHFLFNTLNMAYASAIKNSDNDTADIIEKLSGLMRYNLYECNDEKVFLENEVRYIQDYIDLQMRRLAPDISAHVNVHMEGDWHSGKIAPMILLPFIENVFKHGVILSRNPEILIRMIFKPDLLILETKNVKSPSETTGHSSSGIGLKNVRKRLQLVYPDRHKLDIYDNGNLFEVYLKIQL
jgi:two-component system, LytTR family, sensor kinase